MQSRATYLRWVIAVAAIAVLGSQATAQLLPPPPPTWMPKLDPVLQTQVSQIIGSSAIVVRAVNAGALAGVSSLLQQAGGTLGRQLGIINGRAVVLPNASLAAVASSPLVAHLSLDRVVLGTMERTGATIGATA